MSCNRQGSECAKISTILESDQAERNDHKENGFLMHMPAKQEGCVTAERDRTDEHFPTGLSE